MKSRKFKIKVTNSQYMMNDASLFQKEKHIYFMQIIYEWINGRVQMLHSLVFLER